MVRIERDTDGSRHQECVSLARGLREGFNENGVEAMAEQLPGERTFIAVSNHTLVGFASIAEHGSQVSELSWFAVKDDHQGQGIGTRLLQEIYRDSAAAGVELMKVKTLADTVDDENYERTREFYENEGFLHIETIDPYPEWDPGNPCAIYVRPLTEGDH